MFRNSRLRKVPYAPARIIDVCIKRIGIHICIYIYVLCTYVYTHTYAIHFFVYLFKYKHIRVLCLSYYLSIHTFTYTYMYTYTSPYCLPFPRGLEELQCSVLLNHMCAFRAQLPMLSHMNRRRHGCWFVSPPTAPTWSKP